MRAQIKGAGVELERCGCAAKHVSGELVKSDDGGEACARALDGPVIGQPAGKGAERVAKALGDQRVRLEGFPEPEPVARGGGFGIVCGFANPEVEEAVRGFYTHLGGRTGGGPRACQQIVDGRVAGKGPFVGQGVERDANWRRAGQTGLAERRDQFFGFEEFVPVMGAAREPAEDIFCADNGESKGFGGPVHCGEDDDAARGKQLGGGFQEGSRIGDVFDDFEIEHDIIGASAFSEQGFGGAGAEINVETAATGMGEGGFDVRFGGVNAGYVGAEPCHRLADETAAAAYVEQFQAGQRCFEAFAQREMGFEGFADEIEPDRIKLVQWTEFAARVPPFIGHSGEFGDFVWVNTRRLCLFSMHLSGLGHNLWVFAFD